MVRWVSICLLQEQSKKFHLGDFFSVTTNHIRWFAFCPTCGNQYITIYIQCLINVILNTDFIISCRREENNRWTCLNGTTIILFLSKLFEISLTELYVPLTLGTNPNRVVSWINLMAARLILVVFPILEDSLIAMIFIFSPSLD